MDPLIYISKGAPKEDALWARQEPRGARTQEEPPAWSSLCPPALPGVRNGDWELTVQSEWEQETSSTWGVCTASALRVLCVFNQASEEQGASMGRSVQLRSLSQTHTCTYTHTYIHLHTQKNTHRDVHIHPCVSLLFFHRCN